MGNIVEKIKTISNLYAIKGCSEEQIKVAEEELGIKFPEEYIDYVKEYGCIDFGGTEWTGLNIDGRLNTVYATKQEMAANSFFPKGFFVLENIGIDAKKIIVNEKGEVCLLQYEKVTHLFDSLTEYLDLCIKKNMEDDEDY